METHGKGLKKSIRRVCEITGKIFKREKYTENERRGSQGETGEGRLVLGGECRKQ